MTADTELTYEYGVRSRIKPKKGKKPEASTGASVSAGAEPGPAEVPPLLIGGRAHLPFQLQITYTGQDGSRCLRVITQAKPTTQDRTVAEKGRGQGLIRWGRGYALGAWPPLVGNTCTASSPAGQTLT